MATSIDPTAANAIKSIAAVMIGAPACTAATAALRLTAMVMTEAPTVVRAPKRPTTLPARGKEIIDPKDPTSNNRPIWLAVKPNWVCTVGMREAHEENTTPAAKNTTSTAATLVPKRG